MFSSAELKMCNHDAQGIVSRAAQIKGTAVLSAHEMFKVLPSAVPVFKIKDGAQFQAVQTFI